MAVHDHRPREADSPAPAVDPPGEIQPTLRYLWDRAWLLALCVLVATLGAGFYAYRAPRLFQATATVQVEAIEPHIIRVEQVMQEELRREVSVNTMVQRLRSRPLLARVLETERLDQEPAFRGPNQEPPPTPAELLPRLEGMVTTALRRMTRLVDINVTSPDPELSARIANAIVREFSELDLVTQRGYTRDASGYLQQEADRLQVKVQAAEESLQRFREQAGSIGVQHSQTYFLPKLQEANLRLGQARAEAARLQSNYEQICAFTNQPDELMKLPLAGKDPALAPSRQRVEQAAAEFAARKLRYKAKHPKYQQAAQQLEEARRALQRELLQLPDRYRLAQAAALATAVDIEAEVKRTEADALRLSAQEIEFNLLSRQVESDRALLSSVIKRLAETRVTTDLRSEKIRPIQPAIPPRTPSSPKVLLILAAGVLAGLLGGLALVFGLRAFDRSIQSVEEAEAALGLPVLQLIPRLKGVPATGPRLVTQEQSQTAGAEAFRTLRTAIALLGPAQHQRSVLFTSTAPQEGKTFTSVNYAAALAQQGLPTLVVDADLRRPSVQEYLTGDDEPQPGLTDYLTGQKTLAEIVQPVAGHPNFFWVAAGQPALNPAELLLRDRLQGFLAEALQRYERVVVDSAPVSAVSDTLTFAANCQLTVLVIRSHFTPRRPIQRTVQLLRQAGARLSGVVLNLEPRHWGPGKYSYRYDSAYGEYGQDRRKQKSGTPRPADAVRATKRGPGV
jgi:capsular exopolysaccharide synthesis family protein